MVTLSGKNWRRSCARPFLTVSLARAATGGKDHEESGDGEIAAAQAEGAGLWSAGAQLPQEGVVLAAASGDASGTRMSGGQSVSFQKSPASFYGIPAESMRVETGVFHGILVSFFGGRTDGLPQDIVSK